MERFIPALLFSLILVGCNVKSTEHENLSDVDSIKTDPGLVNDPTPTPDQLKQFLDSRVGVSFDEYKMEAFILPNKSLNIYATDLTTTIETIPIDTIQPFTISHKTKTKMPEMASTEFCNWSNFIKGYFNDKKEKIIFGRWVYGVLHRHQIMNSINGDSIILYSISNFEMGNFSDDGLTDCGDYSIMIIKNQANDKLSFVKAIKEQKQFPNQYVMMAYLKVSPLFKPLHIP